jgi:VanZ like family/Concanavalin A-like lectin/glucanases superfamily
MKPKLLGVLCLIVLCIILTLGLWPLHAPRNDVTWLKRDNGLAFGKYGTLLSSDALKADAPKVGGVQTPAGASIEIWVQPDRRISATLLALYNPGKRVLFTLRQSLTDLELHAEVFSGPEAASAHFYADDALGSALRQNKPVMVTVTSGPKGTMVYLNGLLAKVEPHFWIPDSALTGRLIVGDSPRQPDSFRGQIRGLSIYDIELNGAQILGHYQSWIKNGRPDVAQDERNVALYLFNERTGDTIHNYAAKDLDLHIPRKYAVVDKIALEPFWKEFNWSGSYWRGNLKNIIGFLPVGFCAYAYFMAAYPIKRAVLVTVAIGALVSLTIEVLQAFLPTRDSGTTDLITNTLGTYVGVLCYTNIYPIVVERFPWLGWLAAPHPSAMACKTKDSGGIAG